MARLDLFRYGLVIDSRIAFMFCCVAFKLPCHVPYFIMPPVIGVMGVPVGVQKLLWLVMLRNIPE